jgi:homoserine kinase
MLIRVPASTSNLGPGFDCVGAALGIGLELRFTEGEPSWTYRHGGLGPAHEPPDASLVLSAAARVLGSTPSGALEMSTDIPMGCGLGSSAAAIAAGLLLGCALDGRAIDRGELLRLGTPLEGHADNLAPSLFGGVTLVLPASEGTDVLRFVPHESIVVVILLPKMMFPTSEARRVLPDRVERVDAVKNIARSSGLIALLSGTTTPTTKLLHECTEDLLHQPYRAPLMPETASAIERLRAAGVPAAVSGAGPSIVCLLVKGDEDEPRRRIAALGGWSVLDAGFDLAGAGIVDRNEVGSSG